MDEPTTDRARPRLYPWRVSGKERELIPRAAIDDKRKYPRLRAVEHKAWLCWRSGPDVVADAVLLVNIGRGGAALLVVDPPAVGDAVWLCLHPGPVATGRAYAKVSGVEPLAEKIWRVRLSFDSRCPADLLEAAASGHAAFRAGLS